MADPGESTSERKDDPLIGSLLKIAETVITRELESRLRKRGVSVTQYLALTMLDRRPDTAAARLAERTFVTAQAMSQTIATLERKKLVERRSVKGDARTQLCRLTPAGQAVFAECHADALAIEAVLLAELDPDEASTLRQLLRRSIIALRDKERVSGSSVTAALLT